MAATVKMTMAMHLLSLVVKNANAIVRRRDYSIRRWLANLEELSFPALSYPIKGVSTEDVIIDEGKGLWVRVFTPQAEKKKKKKKSDEVEEDRYPVVIYFHGGGFAVLAPNFFLYDIFCRRLAHRANCIVISVNYRRSPEHRYPVAHEDSFEILQWLSSSSNYYNPAADFSRCFLSGDSAGGNLAHHVNCRAAMEGLSSGNSTLRIRGVILIQPFFGANERAPSEIDLGEDAPIINMEMTDWYWKAYLPVGEDRDHPICNVFGPRASPDAIAELALPPSLVIVGEYDLLRDWQLQFAEGLKKLGKDVRVRLYKQGVHVFHIFFLLDASSQLLSEIAAFVREEDEERFHGI